MKHLFNFAFILFVIGKMNAQPWLNNPNPMAQFYKEKGWPAWSDGIKWTNRINMAQYANGVNDFQKFENARDELAAQGGGVLYYPSGTYNFADHPTGPNTGRGLMLKKGVVILGDEPTTDMKAVRDSVTSGLSTLGTKFLFPFLKKPTANGGFGEVPEPWNMIGLYAGNGEKITNQSNLGIAWVNLVGAYIYFGSELSWATSYRELSDPTSPNSAYRKSRNSIFPGETVAWNERIPNGTFPGDPLFGAYKNGTYQQTKGSRFVFGCRFDDCAVSDQFMEQYSSTGSGANYVKTDSVDLDAYHTFRFSARLNVDGGNVFVANNAITKSDKNFYYNQKIRRHPQVVSGGPWQTKTILYDYGKQGGIDINKSGLSRAGNLCDYINGPYTEENVVVRDNYVFSHGHKGYEIGGKWMIVKENYNDRIYLKEGDNIYGLPSSGQIPNVYELVLDGYSESGVNSDNMSRAFDMAGWCAWIDGNWYQGTGSNPGNDGEGILYQPQGAVTFSSVAETFNRQGPTGSQGFIGTWDVPVYGMFQGWNRQRGGVGIIYANGNAVEDAVVVQNTHPQTGALIAGSGSVGGSIIDLSFTCPAASPAAPDSVVITPDFEKACIKIKWKDMANNEVAFRIDRRVAGNADWTTIVYRPANVTGSVVNNWSFGGCFHPGILDLNPQEWYDYLAVPGEFYEYRVLAIDCNNNEMGAAPVPPVVEFPVITSVGSKKLEIKFGLYPNPTDEELHIFSNTESLDAKLQISDLAGRSLINERMIGSEIRVDVKDLPKGIYFVTLQSAGKVVNRRFVKR